MARTYKQQLADLLKRREYRGWSGQITRRGYPSTDRCEVVAELFAPTGGEVKTLWLVRPDETLAISR